MFTSRCLAFPLFAALFAASEARGPEFYVERPIFDFGHVDSGDEVAHSFVFTNRGDASLKIQSLKFT
jgi:uncharacterized protein DUF1573